MDLASASKLRVNDQPGAILLELCAVSLPLQSPPCLTVACMYTLGSSWFLVSLDIYTLISLEE